MISDLTTVIVPLPLVPGFFFVAVKQKITAAAVPSTVWETGTVITIQGIMAGLPTDRSEFFIYP